MNDKEIAVGLLDGDNLERSASLIRTEEQDEIASGRIAIG